MKKKTIVGIVLGVVCAGVAIAYYAVTKKRYSEWDDYDLEEDDEYEYEYDEDLD